MARHIQLASGRPPAQLRWINPTREVKLAKKKPASKLIINCDIFRVAYLGLSSLRLGIVQLLRTRRGKRGLGLRIIERTRRIAIPTSTPFPNRGEPTKFLCWDVSGKKNLRQFREAGGGGVSDSPHPRSMAVCCREWGVAVKIVSEDKGWGTSVMRQR